MSLRDQFKVLAPEIKIPDAYYIHSKPNKRGNRTNKSKRERENFGQKEIGFQRNESVFTSCPILIKAENSFVDKLKKEVPEIEKQTRKIRGIMNKVTKDNIEKLGNTLVNDFEYNYELLQELVKFIFERATALSFPELYADLTGFLRRRFKEKGADLANGFRVKLVEKCRETFYKEDLPLQGDEIMDAEYKRRRRLIGNIKFIGLLFKQRMIKADIMFECFNVLLKDDTICDETIETSCHLFKESAQLLVSRKPEELRECYNKLVSFKEDTRFSKRILFMLQDVVEKSHKLMTPTSQAKSLNSTPVKEVSPIKNIGKGVKFASFEEEDKEAYRENAGPAPTILKKSISQSIKDTIRGATRSFIQNKDVTAAVERYQEICQENPDKQRQMLHVIFKYILCEYNILHDFEIVCEAVKRLTAITKLQITHEIVETSLINTIEVLGDIKLDSPQAPLYMKHIISYSKTLGIVDDVDALLKHLEE